jgi:protein-tyrosine phosphatase
MFRLFSRSKPITSHQVYRELKVDMHSHLLPGIDDGSPDLATSVALVKGMEEIGYSKLITTPHIMWDIYKNSRQMIESKMSLLRDALNENNCQVEVRAAAEYFLDEHVASLVKNNEPLLTLSENLVLVEFSLAYPSHMIKDILFDMQMQGYQPVIAHAERYIYLYQNRKFYEELKTIGCLFQLNILSLGGHYGKTVTELANFLIKKGYYDLVGSDLHHRGHLEALQNPVIISALKKLFDTGKIRNPSL